MTWPELEAALDLVLERRWYTNHGPAARALEAHAATLSHSPHAVLATNPTIAVLMLADALGLSGTVALPGEMPPFVARALRGAGLTPSLVPGATPPFHLGCCTSAGPTIWTLPCPGEQAGLACILTADDALAARLRNIRSSYGAGPPVPVTRTANGRVSEIQAVLALQALGGC